VIIAAIALASCSTPQTSDVPAERSPAPDSASSAANVPPAPAPRPVQPPALVTQADDVTDAEGRFELRNLATGAYRVTFGEPTDATYTRLDGVQVNAIYGANLLDLRMEPASGSAPLAADEYQPNRRPHLIRGNVVDVSGSPVAGVQVRARKQ
jgi:hypothetical protein